MRKSPSVVTGGNARVGPSSQLCQVIWVLVSSEFLWRVLHNLSWYLYKSVQPAITKYHRVGALSNRRWFSHFCPRGAESPRGAGRGFSWGFSPRLRGFSLSPHRVFLACVHIPGVPSFFLRTSALDSGPTLKTSWITLLSQLWMSSHWGLGLQRTNFRETESCP